jgi:hypothetical protein
MKTKPDFKFGDQVVFIGDRQKRGVVSRVFRSGGLWWPYEVAQTMGLFGAESCVRRHA